MFRLPSVEKVISLDDFPQSSVGAPCPIVLASEHSLFVAFYLEDRDPNWDGKSVRMVDLESVGEPVAIAQFDEPSVHTFGPPNDEAFSGHRLAGKGLKPYGAYEVLNSKWIDQFEKMNSVHPQHNRARFLADKRHFILTFHDSTFECIAKNFRVECTQGSLKAVMASCLDSCSACHESQSN